MHEAGEERTIPAQGEPATVILASSSDLASMTLARALLDGQGFASTGIDLFGSPLYQRGSLFLSVFPETIVSPPPLDEFFNPVAYVFLSRHSSESGIPSLTAHTTGNFGEASFGGADRELGRADPALLKGYLISLSRKKALVHSFEVTLEATHHGPTSLQKPVMFVELGSSEKDWGNAAAAKVVGEALVESLTERRVWDKVGIAFGGTHYSEKFTRAEVEGEFAITHVAPKHVLGEVDEAMLGQMLQKSAAPVRFALLDWKGLGAHKERITGLASTFGLEQVRV
jgi:D-aminoacyl-tRNA deacylase